MWSGTFYQPCTQVTQVSVAPYFACLSLYALPLKSRNAIHLRRG